MDDGLLVTCCISKFDSGICLAVRIFYAKIILRKCFESSVAGDAYLFLSLLLSAPVP